MTAEELFEKYYCPNKPVILFDEFARSKALMLWTPEYFADAFGSEIVEIMMDRQSDPSYEMNSLSHKRAIALSDYIHMLQAGGPTNDYYLVANNHLFDRPAFSRLYDDLEWPPYLEPSLRKDRVFFWLGPAGTITPLHHDECNILLLQIRGRKLIHMISPDYTPKLYNNVGVFSDVDLDNPDWELHPLFKDVAIQKATLHPGEALFIPVGWWHHVRALDPTISVSFTNFSFPNSFAFFAPSIR
jgi:hypothetical protein